MTTRDLISEMEAYAKRAGISPATVGRNAGQGGTFYGRLRKGCRAWPETIEKVRAYMRANPADKSRKSACMSVAKPTDLGAARPP